MLDFECIDCEVAFAAPSYEDAVCPLCESTLGVSIGWSDSEDYGWDSVSADADALAGIGWGTDEDYGYYGE